MPWPLENNGLTARQNRFVKEFVHGDNQGNATQSAISAGYSAKTARQIGSENLSKPDVRDHINKELQGVRERLNDEYVLRTIEELLESAKEQGQLHNALKAVELIGKINKMFIDRVEITAKTYEDELAELPAKHDIIDVIPENQPNQPETPELDNKQKNS